MGSQKKTICEMKQFIASKYKKRKQKGKTAKVVDLLSSSNGQDNGTNPSNEKRLEKQPYEQAFENSGNPKAKDATDNGLKSLKESALSDFGFAPSVAFNERNIKRRE